MATASDWAGFLTGDYDLYFKNPNTSQWERQGAPGSGVHISFAVNGEPEDVTAQKCLKVVFTPRNMPNWALAEGFFHLVNFSGGDHISGVKHPNNWHGNSVVTPNRVLDGGVMEGPGGYGGKYFRLGLWEATDNGENTFYPPGIPSRVKFQGKLYAPISSPLNEVRLLSTWKKIRPDDNYPWNLP